MKKAAVAIICVCCFGLLPGCLPPREPPPVQHELKALGTIQEEIFVGPGVDDALVTAFAVKLPDGLYHDDIRYVALRGARADEIKAGAKIELTYWDIRPMFRRWTAVADKNGYKNEVLIVYHAVTRYKITSPPPTPKPPTAPKEDEE